ncbi:hypothetical protein [Chryseobacterium sp. R2A-55]|uniref:hypothetical protein n=1 Tax=Chryseobacterium sp. R2A-55 TaxID=2744445 RepID=UPI001F40D2E5|nr:hypothetical protein [Chryseobacterium sp. R2A-55]
MNNLQQQKFQFLRFTETNPNNDRYGIDIWDKDKIFLKLKPGEIYALYLDLGLDPGESIIVTALYSIGGTRYFADIHYVCKITEVNRKHYFVFYLSTNMVNTECNSFYFSFVTSKRNIFSNIFNLTKDDGDLSHTTLITFLHSENFYNANYFDNNKMPQQIRVPMWYSHDVEEVEAEKYNDSYQLENKYRSGKVKRLFFENWKVLMNDANYTPFSVAMDCDDVYFDKVFFSVKPFEREQDSDEKGFTFSKLEAQRIPGKIFDDSVFGDFFQIRADDITYNFDYHHAPENTPLSGETFLTNQLFVNYTNFFGVVYECGLKVLITQIPTKGKLHNFAMNKFISAGDIISYCDKDELVYTPNGFDNEYGVYGNYTVNFKYKIIDHLGNTGSNIMTQTINMTDLSEVIPIILQASIIWSDGTSADKSGTLDGITMRLGTEVHDINCEPLQFIWQRENNGNWTNFDFGNHDVTAALFVGDNKFRLKLVDNCGGEAISNVLNYTKSQPTFPTQNYGYRAIHPEGHPGEDYVIYLDQYGNEQTRILPRVETGLSPCILIVAHKIIEKVGATACTGW